MKPVVTLIACLFVVAGCQSLPDNQTAPAIEEGINKNVIFLSAQHCLSENEGNPDKVHYGPCLKITNVNDSQPQVRDDGFIELPVATAVTLGTSCVYRHSDGSPIPITMETTDFLVTPKTFTDAGERWYLHAHKQVREIVGCKPTLSRSKKPSRAAD